MNFSVMVYGFVYLLLEGIIKDVVIRDVVFVLSFDGEMIFLYEKVKFYLLVLYKFSRIFFFWDNYVKFCMYEWCDVMFFV